MHLKGKRILVIGGTGFIGSRLSESLVLEHGANVSIVSRERRRAAHVARHPVRLLHGNVENQDLLRAAIAGHDIIVDCTYPSEGSARCRRARGRRIAQNLTEATLSSGAERLVHMSSVMAYGCPEDGALDECTPCRQSRDPYGNGKHAVEQSLLQAYKDRALPVVVLQPTIVYGPSGYWTTHPIQQLRAGPVALPNNGGGFCNAVYVDDVVAAIILAMTRPEIDGQRFLISAAEPVTWRAFYRALINGLSAGELRFLDSDSFPKVSKRKARYANSARLQFERLFQEFRTNAALRQTVIKFPILARVAGIARNALPHDNFAEFKGYMLRENKLDSAEESCTASVPSLVFPPPQHVQLYAARCHVRIEKARRMLGYTPRFDLEQGMCLTTRWAKLVGL